MKDSIAGSTKELYIALEESCMGTIRNGKAEMSKGRADEIGLHRDKREFLTGLRAETLEEDDHLWSEEIAAYVAGKMDTIDRDCAQSHLECCETCFREMHELRDWVMKTTLRASLK